MHLACLDDAFKTAGVQVTLDGVTHFESDGLSYGNIDQMRNHELTGNYVVTGFKIKGGKGNESVVLIGTKYVSMAGDHMELQTPKIPLDQSSSYTWHNELSEVCELIREEVALYYQMTGRAMRPHPNKQTAWIVDLGGNYSFFGKIETMEIRACDKGLLSIWQGNRQLTNVSFQKK